MRDFLHHLLIPRHTNNFRARILHASVLSVFALLFFTLSVSVQYVKTNYPQVLGISYSINTEELLNETNNQRVATGLPPLSINEKLSQAAQGKAVHMISNNYWAHFAPDGTTPWSFIKSSGYEYSYAGENLAKGFTNSNDVVAAWMNSPSHKENILSSRYDEIGFAIIEGNLEGEETVLVVQMFGSSNVTPIVEAQQPVAAAPDVVPEALEVPAVVPVPQDVLQEQVVKKPIVDSRSATKGIGIFLIIFLAAILIIDLLIVERRKIPRIAGHNLDHIILFLLFFLFIMMENSSGIL